MTDARAAILGDIRRALGRGVLDDDTAAALDARMASPVANTIPARGGAPVVDGFIAMAERSGATLARVATWAAVPLAAADFIDESGLPMRLVMAPDPALDAAPWGEIPGLVIRRGRAEPSDPVSLTGAMAGIAETGTLMLASGPRHPTTLNFLPDLHIVVLRAADIVGAYEEGWARVRAAAALPRTVNFVTGPSRTADIEATLVMGAHGPRRLHIILIEDRHGAPA